MTDRDLIAEARNMADLFTDHAVFSSAGKDMMRRLLRDLADALEAQSARVNELAAQRNPDDEVLVEGFWFHPDDLPKVLGNFMRSSDQYAREAKLALVNAHAHTEIRALYVETVANAIGWDETGGDWRYHGGEDVLSRASRYVDALAEAGLLPTRMQILAAMEGEDSIAEGTARRCFLTEWRQEFDGETVSEVAHDLA